MTMMMTMGQTGCVSVPPESDGTDRRGQHQKLRSLSEPLMKLIMDLSLALGSVQVAGADAR